MFLTTHGHRFVRPGKPKGGKLPEEVGGKLTVIDSVGLFFDKLLAQHGMKRRGLSFYALRHGFETVAGESKDQIAVDHIMGHAREDMASLYRERISDDRLRAVTDHVRSWIFNNG